jgi:hypothetical protein
MLSTTGLATSGRHGNGAGEKVDATIFRRHEPARQRSAWQVFTVNFRPAVITRFTGFTQFSYLLNFRDHIWEGAIVYEYIEE